HLRNKLSAYYARAGASEKWRIDIPKGQYMLVATPNEAPAEPPLSVTGQPLQRKSYTPWLAAVAIALLVLNLVWGQRETPADATGAANPFAATGLWQPLLDDTLPVLVIVGDYY